MRLLNSLTKKSDTRKKALSLVVVIIGVSISCRLPGISKAKDNSPELSSVGDPMEATIMASIAEIELSNPRTLAAANDLLDLGPSAVPALINLLDSPDDLNRWAGIYALNLLAQPEDIPKIAKFLDEPNLSIRARVAATLLMLGDDRGIPVLEEALLSDQVMVFSHPLMLLSDYARLVLEELHPESLGRSQIEGTNIDPLEQTVPEYKEHQRGAGVLASHALAPPGNTSVSVSDCTIDIELNLQFNGPYATNALAATWRNGIIGMWNHELSSSGCSIDLVVNTKVDNSKSPTKDPNYTQIKVIQLPAKYIGHIAVTPGGGSGLSNPRGTWDVKVDGPLAAHEIGHVLGIDDEYEFVRKAGLPTSTIPKGSLPPAIQNDVVGPGDTTPSIMYQDDPDKEGDHPQVRVRHVDQILKEHKLSCICNGLVEWQGQGTSKDNQIKISIYTCDGGKTWDGSYISTTKLKGGLMESETYGQFKLLFENNAVLTTETEFDANGSITTGGVEIGAVDKVILAMIKGANYVTDIKIESQGTKLIAGGTSIGEVDDLLVPTQMSIKVAIVPYEYCDCDFC